MKLRTEAPEGFRPDEIYAKLLAIGHEKNDRESRRAMAALVLLLANHIGDEDVLDEALGIVSGLPPLGPEHDLRRPAGSAPAGAIGGDGTGP